MPTIYTIFSSPTNANTNSTTPLPHHPKRKDSGTAQTISPSTLPTTTTPTPLPTKTLTFTPAQGSTCASLYPRTKTFTLTAPLPASASTCLATCAEDGETWRMSDVPGSDGGRVMFERLSGGDGNVVDVFRRCAVVEGEVGVGGRRESWERRRSSVIGRW